MNAPEKPKIIGDVFIHPHAVVHPTATVSAGTMVISVIYDLVMETETFYFENLKTSNKSKLVLENSDKCATLNHTVTKLLTVIISNNSNCDLIYLGHYTCMLWLSGIFVW